METRLFQTDPMMVVNGGDKDVGVREQDDGGGVGEESMIRSREVSKWVCL